MENTAFSGKFETAETDAFLRIWTECRQRAQRLWKCLHRDDAEPVRVLSGHAGVVPSGHEKGVHTRLVRTDRLLLDAADRADRAVRADLAGGRDLVTVDDVPAQLLEHLEREREPGRGA